MRERISLQTRLWFMISFFVTGIFHGLLAQEPQVPPPAPDGLKPLYFRKVYVPAKDLDVLIKGTMPLKRKSFLEMVDAINRSARDELRSSDARVVSARYSAHLLGEDLVEGMAFLEIEKAPGDPAMLSLSPHGLAWGRAQWDTEPAAPAITGMDAMGNWSVVVEKSGRLRIPWSLKGRSVSANRKQFDFWVPPSATSRLDLQLPQKSLLSTSKGLALPVVQSRDVRQRQIGRSSS